MKKVIEIIAALVVLLVATMGAVVGYGIYKSWRGEHTNMVIFGGFILLAVTVITVGWVVNNGISSAQRRRDETNAPPPYYAPPQHQSPLDFLRYENARIQYERQRIALERDRQKLLGPGQSADPLEDFYQQASWAPAQPSTPAQPAPSPLADDEW